MPSVVALYTEDDSCIAIETFVSKKIRPVKLSSHKVIVQALFHMHKQILAYIFANNTSIPFKVMLNALVYFKLIMCVFCSCYLGFEDNFDKLKTSQVAPLTYGYDYNSIMHYHPSSFSNNGEDTIVAHDPNIELGQAQELSPLDILETNQLYKCTKPHPPPSIVLPEESTVSTKPPTNPYSCGNVYDGQLEGTITTPNYPTYAHNQDCGWVIKVPPGFLLTLTFQPLLVERR